MSIRFRFLLIALAVATSCVALTSGQDISTTETENTTTDVPSTTSAPQTTTTTTAAPKTTTTTAPKTTTLKPTTPTPPITTQAPTTSTSTPAPTTHSPAPTTPSPAPTTTTPRPEPKEATLGNYTVMNGDEVCLFAQMKVTVIQNSTRYPLANGNASHKGSECSDDKVTLWVDFQNSETLQIVVVKDKTNFFISEISVQVDKISADKNNLTQFSTPLKSFYKCQAASEVDLVENNIHVIFSDMKFQAFTKEKSAQFTGSEFECVSDYHSDVVIIAIGCALALLVVVILVAYLIARRRSRQNGYQSV